MTSSTRAKARDQTSGEEIANSVSHGIGLLLALGGLPVIVQSTMQRGRAADARMLILVNSSRQTVDTSGDRGKF